MKNSFSFYQGAAPGINSLGKRFLESAVMRQKAENDTLDGLTQSELRMQQAAKTAAEAQALQNRQNTLGDDAGFIAGMSGAPSPMVQKFLDYAKTGNYGTLQPLTPNDDDGNVNESVTQIAVPPELAPHLDRINRARQTLFATRAAGTANPDQIARSLGEFQGQGITDAVQQNIARGDVNLASAQNQGGKLGQQIKLFGNAGGTGATFNQATGDVRTDNALAQSEIAKNLVQRNEKPATLRPVTDAQGRLWNFNSQTGEFSPSLEPGTGAQIQGKNTAPEKALPHSSVKDLAAAGEAVENTNRMSRTFKPEYGGHFILGDMLNKMKRIVGDETGMAQWWQDMDMLQNQTRHTLFGSALTATELAAWEKTSVNPRMNAKEIETNLARRAEIEARAASKLARAYAVAGYNKEQIKELVGIGAQYLDQPAPPATQQPGRNFAPPTATPPAKPNNTPPPKIPEGTRRQLNGEWYIRQGGQWIRLGAGA